MALAHPGQLVSGRWSEPEQPLPQSVPWRPGAEFQVSGVRGSVLPTDLEPGALGFEHSVSDTISRSSNHSLRLGC